MEGRTDMNEQTETLNQSAPASLDANDMPAGAARGEIRAENIVAQQGDGGSCGCGAAPDSGANGGAAVSFVYAIGRVEARFPNLAAEKEFAQATGRDGHRWQNRSTDVPCGSVASARTVT